MNVIPIRTEEDYEWALREIETYFLNEPSTGTADADRFDVLATLIKAYEDREYPVEEPDPVDALAAHLDNAGLKSKDLAQVIGSPSRASEVLSRKRRLTVDMAFKINAAWGLPVELLVRPYSLDGRRAA